jgi:hypothetical protein
MPKTTLIRSGTVVNADLSERADVLISMGRSWPWARSFQVTP